MSVYLWLNYPRLRFDDGSPSTHDFYADKYWHVAWLRGEPGVRDMCILEAPEEEGIYVAGIDLDMLRTYRASEVMGNKFRHPGVYGELGEE